MCLKFCLLLSKLDVSTVFNVSWFNRWWSSHSLILCKHLLKPLLLLFGSLTFVLPSHLACFLRAAANRSVGKTVSS